ncbi:hypothetical protein [Georgenia sp. AZ-5]|uniref:hypothetical protein n=1 Tax=Georgenia sp. AZ-5 TaxID=3367526 RepID=UPI003754AFFA
MRLTESVVMVEATVHGWMTSASGWWVYRDERTRRNPARPSFVALHPGLGITLAVYARPRRLHPSELPDPSVLPAGVVAAVWHPGVARQVRVWLSRPFEDPPGVLG